MTNDLVFKNFKKNNHDLRENQKWKQYNRKYKNHDLVFKNHAFTRVNENYSDFHDKCLRKHITESMKLPCLTMTFLEFD